MNKPPDQAQREQALDSARSILVQAPAGSGKTTLLAERFLRLLGEVDSPGQVVAITFTIAAAAEMRHRILGELEKAAGAKAQHFLSDNCGTTEVVPCYKASQLSSLSADNTSPLSRLSADNTSRLSSFSADNTSPLSRLSADTTSQLSSLSAASLVPEEESSIEFHARRALERSEALGWKLLDLPAQLRIATIDSFCRELALQQPLLTGLGGGLEIAEQPEELYRRAARETLRKIDETDSALSAAIENLLLWRDNGWQEMEALLVTMLGSRDRWMHGFVLEREPDWDSLRARLERPFASAVRESLSELSRLLDQVPGAREEALTLARFACEQSSGALHRELAELVELPSAPFADVDEARQAHLSLAELLLIGVGTFRKQITIRLGFPADRKKEKGRLLELIAALAAVPGLEAALAEVRTLPPARYSEDEWEIVKACFTLLRHAAGELRIAFAEAGRVDFIEVAQIAQRVLRGEDGQPTDAAIAVSDNIRHLLVDEFQDTSRRQHQLLSSLIAAWPEREGRTCFVVGDPMQSIYFFRDADAELFPRVKTLGLEVPHDEPLLFDFVPLTANFRTAPELVKKNNEIFVEVFAVNNENNVTYSSANPFPEERTSSALPFSLHLKFVPPAVYGQSSGPGNAGEESHEEQIDEIIALIRSQMSRIEAAKASGGKYRVAVLGRAKKHLAPIAQALREAAIPFRAVELEKLADRPEVLDALALARALLNPQDRVAWLGVLRAPWCGLSLGDLHTLAGSDEVASRSRTVPELLAERLSLLSEEGRAAAGRVLHALTAASALRAAQPTASLGSWLEAVWLRLGGAACADATARANLNLLWSCLDRLPNGEEDLLGASLDAALDKLTALPDPEAASDSGVQLMTIHKSKGLEFEVVIVPELQAGSGRGRWKMLSWLERGLTQPDDSGEITEFLIAPFQRKGEERGSAKAWVDSVYRERESQEMRRILYVAATRAREELHLFARPACKTEADGSLSLAEPVNSLLATAWPALEAEVRARFAEWNADRTAAQMPDEQVVESIAAAGSNLLVMPARMRYPLLRRLPVDFRPAAYEAGALSSPVSAVGIYSRHEGGMLSRALGTAVHSLLEELARLRTTLDEESARLALAHIEPRVAAQARSVGIDRPQAAQIAADALQLALNASHDPIGSWILSPHTDAASEVSWAGVVDGGLRAVRVDRVFRAGATPGSEGDDCWWIIDYKSAHTGVSDPATALPALRKLFAPQIEAYAEILRRLHGREASGCAIRAGLYYPHMLLLDWWQL
jgi:ATP-dependent exoDNAse (exonuclease V) beta subunit